MEDNKEVKKETKKTAKKDVEKVAEKITVKKVSTKAPVKDQKKVSAIAASNIGSMHPNYKFYVNRSKEWKGQTKTVSEWHKIFAEKGLL